jgi:hypothetical protein
LLHENFELGGNSAKNLLKNAKHQETKHLSQSNPCALEGIAVFWHDSQ